ncbi:MAG: CcmD family protein [Betaproteobacteria bacterium]
MTTIRRALTMAGGLLLTAAPAFALQPGQSEFVPVSSLPKTEQMPAAPLLITAYAFVWVALLVYVWSIWRRLGRVEAEMQALAQRTSQRSGAR